MGACAPRKTGVELESMIASVKDLLPDLGEGFIEVGKPGFVSHYLEQSSHFVVIVSLHQILKIDL